MKLRLLLRIVLPGFLAACGLLNGPPEHIWHQMGLKDSDIYQLADEGSYLYACAGKDGLFRINLQGLNEDWQLLGFSHPNEVQTGVTSFYRNPENNDFYTAFFTTNTTFKVGLYRSIDDGKTWNAFDSGIWQAYQDSSSTSVFCLAAPSQHPGRIYAGATGAIFRKDADSVRWQLLSESQEFGHHVYTIRFDPSDPDEIWAGGENGFGGERLLHSSDAGNTWEIIKTLPSGSAGFHNTVFSIAVNPGNPKEIYVGMVGMVVKSTDGGRIWKITYSGDREDTEQFKAIAINPADTLEVYAAGKYLMHTNDGGADWSAVGDSTVTDFTTLQVEWDHHMIYAAAKNPGGVFKMNY